MNSRRLCRATLAMLAAYAITLQAMLAAFAPAAFLPVSQIVLCAGNGTDGHPVPHEGLCSSACTVLGHQAGVPPPPHAAEGIAAPLVIIAFVAFNQSIAPLAILGPHAPRGPPLV
jgi:hypothetical protein